MNTNQKRDDNQTYGASYQTDLLSSDSCSGLPSPTLVPPATDELVFNSLHKSPRVIFVIGEKCYEKYYSKLLFFLKL